VFKPIFPLLALFGAHHILHVSSKGLNISGDNCGYYSSLLQEMVLCGHIYYYYYYYYYYCLGNAGWLTINLFEGKGRWWKGESKKSHSPLPLDLASVSEFVIVFTVGVAQRMVFCDFSIIVDCCGSHPIDECNMFVRNLAANSSAKRCEKQKNLISTDSVKISYFIATVFY
jgi:hypothetical protein